MGDLVYCQHVPACLGRYRHLERVNNEYCIRIVNLERQLAEAQTELTGFGPTCANCGFRYWEYRGHITPCPRCERDALRGTLAQAREFAEYFGLSGDGMGIRILRDEPKDCWRVAQDFFRTLATLDAGKETEKPEKHVDGCQLHRYGKQGIVLGCDCGLWERQERLKEAGG